MPRIERPFAPRGGKPVSRGLLSLLDTACYSREVRLSILQIPLLDVFLMLIGIKAIAGVRPENHAERKPLSLRNNGRPMPAGPQTQRGFDQAAGESGCGWVDWSADRPVYTLPIVILLVFDIRR